MSEEHLCPELLRIGQRVAQAIEELYRISSAHKAANLGTSERSVLAGQLHEARREQRESGRELREHIKEHGCRQ